MFQPRWFKSPPFEDPQDYANRSAITFVKKIPTPILFVPAIWNIQTNCGLILTRFQGFAGLKYVESRLRSGHSCKRRVWRAGPRPAAHAACIFMSELNRAGPSPKCGARRLHCLGRLSGELHKLLVLNGGKKNVTVCSSITTRTQKTAPRVRRTRCARYLMLESQRRFAGPRCPIATRPSSRFSPCPNVSRKSAIPTRE